MRKFYLISVLFFGLLPNYAHCQNIFPDSGRVGIGTRLPDTYFHIKVAKPAYVKIESTVAGDNAMCWFVTTSRQWGCGANLLGSNGDFEIYDYNNSANRLLINGSGYIGIGTTNPTALLHMESTSTATLYINGNTAYKW